MPVNAISPQSYSSNPNLLTNPNMPEPSKIKEFPTHYELSYKTEASSAKKWGVGIASFLFPGLGQLVNGDWRSALAFAGGSFMCGFLSGASIIKNIPALAIAGSFMNTGLQVWSIVHAVKGAKSEIKQIVPKEQTQFNVEA